MAEAGTARHEDAEQRMRELVEEAGLPQPDEVHYRFDPNEVLLTWNDPKLAVVIDLDEDAIPECQLSSGAGD